MLLLKTLATISLAASSLLASPAMSDKHKTTMSMAVGDNHKFAVSVKRVDDLINDDGKLVSEKWSNVVVAFQVDVDGQITANGKPVELGLSNVKMEAATIEVRTGEADKMTDKQLEEAYDMGVVSMDISAVAERVNVGGIEVTELTLVEKITEVNGVKVEQTVSMQQIFEIKEGRVHSRPPCQSMHSPQQFHSQHAQKLEQNRHHGGCASAKAAKWLRAQPPHVKVFASVFTGAMFGLMILLITRIVARIFLLATYRRPSEQDEEESLYIKKISLKRTEAGDFYVEEHETAELPAYNGNGYAVVSTDEKN